jgi:polar amino acid transport system substrate-binding protein
MKAVVQDFRTGRLSVEDLPPPSPPAGFVLVKNRYSLLSSGTERAMVESARESLIKKAASRPEIISQVVESLKNEGFAATIGKMKHKLARLQQKLALGYSCAGTVVESRAENDPFTSGDRVACGGSGYAVHAEFIIVPENLCVKIPPKISLEEAAFATVGAIAMQGVRRAEPQVGELFCVIGLGLLGILTCEILSSSGVRVYGIDTNGEKVEAARALGHPARRRTDRRLKKDMANFTEDRWFDGVITTASAPSNDPARFSCEILRKRGRNVIVGNYKLDFDREVLFQKELDIRMSTSYGPGRYDSRFEEKGQLYPYEYVRWTEKENMRSFLGLIGQEKVRVRDLISHRFPIDEAAKAYDLVTAPRGPGHAAVLLSYSGEEGPPEKSIVVNPTASHGPGIGFIGAGRFARSFLVPELKKIGADLKAIANFNPVSSRAAAEEFGFGVAAASAEEILNHEGINTVFIATRHDLHHELLTEALSKGKNVFVEKPLCIKPEELDSFKSFLRNRSDLPVYTVGFNRRFAPATRLMKEMTAEADKIVINYSVNAGALPQDFWLFDPDVGGGRLAGEFCHFVDYSIYFLGEIDAISARGFISGNRDFEDFSVILKGERGVSSLLYTSLGSRNYPKERIEIFADGSVLINEDFKRVWTFPNRKKHPFKSKGFHEEIQAFMDALTTGEMPIPQRDLLRNCELIFAIRDLLHDSTHR